jgi:hypothetical protein
LVSRGSELQDIIFIITLQTEIYQAHPVSKVPFTETKHNFLEIFIAKDTASVELFLNIFATGIETFVIPWDQLLNTFVVEVCLATGIGTTV